MKLSFLIICEKAFSTEGTKNLNLIGIFNNIYTSAVPAIHQSMFIAAGLSGVKKGEVELELRLVPPNPEEKTDKFTKTVNIPEGANVYQSITNIINLRLKEFGEYKVEFFVDGKKMGETSFGVKKDA